MKKAAVFLSLIMTLMLLGGCGSKAPKSSQKVNHVEAKKIGFVTGTGGLGDKTYNDLVYSGLKRYDENQVKVEVVEPKEIADFENYQRSFAQTNAYSSIVCVGFDQADYLANVADEFPEQKFVYIDGSVNKPNVASVIIKNEENSFQMGALAALAEKEANLQNMSKKNIIGVVGGMDIPLIRTFVAGYIAGAKYVNPDVEVLVSYVGNWSDPGKAAELAIGMYEKGADIVWQAAGGSGLGVFEAAKKSGKYAMGVDGNQNLLAPDNIIASGVRRIDNIAYDLTKAALDGSFKGGDYQYGLKEKAAEYTTEGSNVKLDKAILDKVDFVTEKVASGEIVVPDKTENVDAFINKYGHLK